jgi:hypothetical protein
VPTVHITVAEHTITAHLADNPTAHDLTEQLPLTLTFRDFNRVEKVAELPRPSPWTASPPATTPISATSATTPPLAASPSTTATVGYWDGIVRIGRLTDRDIELIQRQPDGFQVTIEQA